MAPRRHESVHALVGIEFVEVLDRTPSNGRRFMIAVQHAMRWGKDEETHVEVQMWNLVRRFHEVDVDVDSGHRYREPRQACFLGGFAERDGGQVGIAVRMTARLQPLSELRVMEHQEAIAARVVDERGTREMAASTCPEQGVGVRIDEGQDLGLRACHCSCTT